MEVKLDYGEELEIQLPKERIKVSVNKDGIANKTDSNNGYDVFKLKELFCLVVELTDKYDFKKLKNKLQKMNQ